MAKYIVRTYRDGKHVAHLDRAYDSEAEAKAVALAQNCKAYTPFFNVVHKA